MPSFLRRSLLIALGLVSTAIADTGYVANRSGSTINIFDTVSNSEMAGSPITVGSSPVAIASDQADGNKPLKLLVVNFGSNTVSVVDPVLKTVTATIDGSGSAYGPFTSPAGIARCAGGSLNTSLAVVDSTVVNGSKGTIRFINPYTNSIIFQFRDNSTTAVFQGAAFTSNGRLWIADSGDKGVVVVDLSLLGSGPPWSVGDQLIYTGPGDFADFIYDKSATPTFLLNPQRLATDGSTRVVVADGGSANLTIINATYPDDVESTAIVTNLNLGLAAGMVCIDVKVANGKAYVTTTDPAKPIQVVSLATNAVIKTIVPAITPVGGVGRTSDGTKVYVGTGSGMSTISQIDTGSDTITATIAGFTGGSFPFGFQITGLGASVPPPVPTGPVSNPPGGGNVCGIVGLEALMVLGLLALARRVRDH